MRKLAKYDFSKCYDINSMIIHATLNPCNCNNQSISYLDNFVFAVQDQMISDYTFIYKGLTQDHPNHILGFIKCFRKGRGIM